jgi:2-iminobutanoate/2-iminopropanoate deaminase
MSKQAIVPRNGRTPAGPYSPGIQAAGLIFISGQTGSDNSGKLPDGVEAQTEQVFANLKAVLDAAGKKFDDAVRVGVYLTNMADFQRMNAIYAKHFSQPFPARTTIGVASLPGGAAVEIDMWVA